jgi:predicted transcriptional regulator
MQMKMISVGFVDSQVIQVVDSLAAARQWTRSHVIRYALDRLAVADVQPGHRVVNAIRVAPVWVPVNVAEKLEKLKLLGISRSVIIRSALDKLIETEVNNQG